MPKCCACKAPETALETASPAATNKNYEQKPQSMTDARQNTLQVRLFAMTRILPGTAAAALAFSLVFFSPLIDMKDTIGAAAQSNDRGNDNGNRGGNGRGNQGNSESRGNNGNGNGNSGNSNGGGNSGSEGKGNSNSGSNSGSSNSGGNSGSSGSGGNASGSASSSSSGSSAASDAPKSRSSTGSATEKSSSGSFLNMIFGGRRFSGDSEPSGGALSEREEREAIRNGWQ
jgi:hypothetical protein